MHDSAALTGHCLRHRVQIIMYRPCIESTSLCSPEGRTPFFQQIFPHVVFGWWWWGPVRRVTSLCQCWVWFWFWYWSRAVYSLSLTSVPDLDDFISRLFPCVICDGTFCWGLLKRAWEPEPLLCLSPGSGGSGWGRSSSCLGLRDRRVLF